MNFIGQYHTRIEEKNNKTESREQRPMKIITMISGDRGPKRVFFPTSAREWWRLVGFARKMETRQTKRNVMPTRDGPTMESRDKGPYCFGRLKKKKIKTFLPESNALRRRARSVLYDILSPTPKSCRTTMTRAKNDRAALHYISLSSIIFSVRSSHLPAV